MSCVCRALFLLVGSYGLCWMQQASACCSTVVAGPTCRRWRLLTVRSYCGLLLSAVVGCCLTLLPVAGCRCSVSLLGAVLCCLCCFLCVVFVFAFLVLVLLCCVVCIVLVWCLCLPVVVCCLLFVVVVVFVLFVVVGCYVFVVCFVVVFVSGLLLLFAICFCSF